MYIRKRRRKKELPAEIIEVTLPVHAAGNLPNSLEASLAGTHPHMGPTGLSGAGLAKNDAFPCSKKAMWHERAVLRVVRSNPQ